MRLRAPPGEGFTRVFSVEGARATYYIGWHLVSPYKAGGGLRLARGHRGCAGGLQCAAAGGVVVVHVYAQQSAMQLTAAEWAAVELPAMAPAAVSLHRA